MEEIKTHLGGIGFVLICILIVLCVIGLNQHFNLLPKKDTRWVSVDRRAAYLQILPDLSGPMQTSEFRGYVIFMNDDTTVYRSYVTKERKNYKLKDLELVPLSGESAQLWAERLEQRMFETGRY